MRYTIRLLDASTWAAFAELAERNNGVYGVRGPHADRCLECRGTGGVAREGLALARPGPFPVAELPFAIAEAKAVDSRPDHCRGLAIDTRRRRGVGLLHGVVQVPGCRGTDQPEPAHPAPHPDTRLEHPPQLSPASIAARASAFITLGVVSRVRAPAMAWIHRRIVSRYSAASAYTVRTVSSPQAPPGPVSEFAHSRPASDCQAGVPPGRRQPPHGVLACVSQELLHLAHGSVCQVMHRSMITAYACTYEHVCNSAHRAPRSPMRMPAGIRFLLSRHVARSDDKKADLREQR